MSDWATSAITVAGPLVGVGTQAVKDEWTEVYSRLHAAIRATFGAATLDNAEKEIGENT